MELIKDAQPNPEEHPGCVPRKLTFRDRMLIFQALHDVSKNGADAKTLNRLIKLQDALDNEGQEDYFKALETEYSKKLTAWHKLYESHLVNPSQNQDPGKQPKPTEDEMLGKEATFWIKSNLDAHVASVLREARFIGSNAKYALSLLAKYQIQVEE